MALGIAESRLAAAVLIEVSGELDLDSVNELEAPLLAAVAEPPVILDLTGCGLVDSSGLALILRAWRAAPPDRASPMVVVATGAVRNLFKLTAIEIAIPVLSSRSEAETTIAAARAG